MRRTALISGCLLGALLSVFTVMNGQKNDLKPIGSTQYFFCVGINNYLNNTNPANCKICRERGIKNLTGCLNDLDTITSLFKKYYGFRQEHIIQLRDQQASRAAILNQFAQLQSITKRGDLLVFFYSGHGSYEYEKADDNQQRTGKGYRNTLLPADVIVPGVPDLNSAELNSIFAGFAKKGVVLTVITDCCHSATNTRGNSVVDTDSSREVLPSQELSNLPNRAMGNTIRLDQLGALTLGACQDNELAVETMASGKIYGAFTIALCRSVTEWSQAPIQELLARTITRLRFLNKLQTPNMEADKRLAKNLVGNAAAQIRKSTYSLFCSNCSANQLPQIAAGFSDDLQNGDILVDINSKDSIQVSNLGFSASEVQLINLQKKWKGLNAMDLHFSVLRKIPNPDPPLKIFLGKRIENFKQVLDTISQLVLQKNMAYKWINPSAGKMPDAILFYNQGWKLNRNKKATTITLNSLDTSAINALMKEASIKKAYLQLPPSANLLHQLIMQLSANKNRNIQVVDKPDAADYMLAGHLGNDGNSISYGWEKTNASDRIGSGAGLPMGTDFFSVNANPNLPIDSLIERANRLSVLANWLTIKSPMEDKSLVFPYRLLIKNLGTKLQADGKNSGKSNTVEKLEIGIQKDPASRLSRDSIHPLFVYVVSMDPKGNTYLLYPQPMTSILNYPNTILHDTSFYHLATVRHSSPGYYHYFFIALKEPVANRDIFTRHGVLKSAPAAMSDNPLEALLNEQGSEARGEIKSFDHWILQNVEIKTDIDSPKKK